MDLSILHFPLLVFFTSDSNMTRFFALETEIVTTFETPEVVVLVFPDHSHFTPRFGTKHAVGILKRKKNENATNKRESFKNRLSE